MYVHTYIHTQARLLSKKDPPVTTRGELTRLRDSQPRHVMFSRVPVSWSISIRDPYRILSLAIVMYMYIPTYPYTAGIYFDFNFPSPIYGLEIWSHGPAFSSQGWTTSRAFTRLWLRSKDSWTISFLHLFTPWYQVWLVRWSLPPELPFLHSRATESLSSLSIIYYYLHRECIICQDRPPASSFLPDPYRSLLRYWTHRASADLGMYDRSRSFLQTSLPQSGQRLDFFLQPHHRRQDFSPNHGRFPLNSTGQGLKQAYLIWQLVSTEQNRGWGSPWANHVHYWNAWQFAWKREEGFLGPPIFCAYLSQGWAIATESICVSSWIPMEYLYARTCYVRIQEEGRK